MIESASFGAWLKERRKALGMTRDDLADQVGCAAVTIIKIERGQRRPSRQVAECIVAALRISPDEREAVVQWARGTLDAAVPSVPALSTQASTNTPAEPRALLEAVPARLDNLPAALNSFVGREQEVGRV
ncbi:MAG TPA: helix-turn-helix transcriptional regulator, partial [Chloroflexia bacterium]|nr:helix-turn-helix transcriptional regulator [Chloroflexia bacterium]